MVQITVPTRERVNGDTLSGVKTLEPQRNQYDMDFLLGY